MFKILNCKFLPIFFFFYKYKEIIFSVTSEQLFYHRLEWNSSLILAEIYQGEFHHLVSVNKYIFI